MNIIIEKSNKELISMTTLNIGDLIFVDSGSFVNKVIQKVSKFEYGHVAVIVNDSTVVDIRAGNSYSLVDIKDMSISKFTVARVRGGFDVNRFMRVVSHSGCLKVRYNYRAIGRLFLNYKLKLPAKRKPFNGKNIYCSEFVDYLFYKSGIRLQDDGKMTSVESLYKSDKLEFIAHGSSLEELLKLYGGR